MCRRVRETEWEADYIPQSADEAMDGAFRVQRHDVSNVKETRPVF